MKTDKQHEIRRIMRVCFGIDPNTVSPEFMYKLHHLTSITSVYETAPNSSESIISYTNKVKDLVTSDEYTKLNSYSKKSFEMRMFRILNNVVVKSIGCEYFEHFNYLLNATNESISKLEEFCKNEETENKD